jgi:hypothetical protein
MSAAPLLILMFAGMVGTMLMSSSPNKEYSGGSRKTKRNRKIIRKSKRNR